MYYNMDGGMHYKMDGGTHYNIDGGMLIHAKSQFCVVVVF